MKSKKRLLSVALCLIIFLQIPIYSLASSVQNIPNSTYYIKSVYSGKYLSINESTGKAVQTSFTGATNQQWTFVYKSNGFYELISGSSTSGSRDI